MFNSWNKIKIRKQIKSTTDEMDKMILKVLLNDKINPFDSETYPRTDEANKSIIEEYAIFLSEIEKFSLTPKFNDVKQEQIRIPINSQLDFLYELFSYVTPKWMEIFDKIYKERKSNLKMAKSGNYSVYLSSIDYSYISVNHEYLIDDLFSLVHEYTHAIVDRIFFRTDYNSHYPFVELPSLNMELVSATFMSEYFLDIDEDILAYLKYIFNIIIDYAERIVRVSEYLSKNSTFPHDFNRSIIIELTYVIPFLYNFELLFLYKEDKEKWFYILNEIINMKPSNNCLEEMKKLGLTPNLKTEEFCEKIRLL